MQLEPPELDHVLSVWPVARLATLAESGRPSVVPIVFAVVDGVVCSPIDGKPKRTVALQRLRNVERDARAALLIDHYGDDWRALWWLVRTGRPAATGVQRAWRRRPAVRHTSRRELCR